MRLDVLGRQLLCTSPDFSDHEDPLCARIILKHLKQFDIICAVNWIATNPNRRTLTKSYAP